MSITHGPDSLEKFRSRFRGILLRQRDAGYEDARRVHNGMIDKRPAVIARCVDASDVGHTIQYARAAGLEIAVRGGGHNVAGRATIDGGLVIDLSLMKKIEIDLAASTATAQAGVLWGELDAATQQHGLATVGGEVSTTGIAGLTLGGGIGWLSGKYGLTVDNLMAAELVNAEGDILRLDEGTHEDLFWAIRGGGGNFGVVTSFTYRLHRVGNMVTGGAIVYPLDQARDVLRFYRDFSGKHTDELRVHVGMRHAPDGSGAKLVAFLLCHCGDPADAAEAIRPLKEFGTPILDAVGPIPYTSLNAMFDADLPKGALNYWKSSFLKGLGDEVIDLLVGAFARCPAPMTFALIEHVGGAVSRVPVEQTAFPHRAEGMQLLILTQWADAAITDAAIGWTREAWHTLLPHFQGARYVNYLDRDDEGGFSAYGANQKRLAEIKAKHDPLNIFHQNHNITPAP